MRRLGPKALAWSALAMASAGAAAGTGCKATRATELIPGVSTQMVVTKDLNAIRIDVEANGEIKFCQQYDVAPNGIVQLPSTLGVIPAQSPDTLVTVTIRGYDIPGSAGNDITVCPTSESGAAAVDAPLDTNANTGPGPRIIRRSIQSYVDGHILFLPMPLSYACQDVDCSMMGAGYACKGGLCVDSLIANSSTLADYDPSLLDGKGLCFSPMACFPDAVPAAVLDSDTCVYGFPPWDTSLAGTGVNVRVFYKDVTWQANPAGGWEQVVAEAGEEEILNEDPIEGFTIVNAADAGLPEAGPTIKGVDAGPTYNSMGPLIQLAPGLCALAKQATKPPPHPASGTLTYHTISDVQVASLCAPKAPLLPVCAGEWNNSPVLPDGGTTTGACNVAIPMQPAPSAMYLVMDQSVYMHGAYGTNGSAQALALSLTDPVFQQTFAAFTYINDPGEVECLSTPSTPSYLAPKLPFDVALDAQPQIAAALNAWAPSETGGSPCNGMGTGTPTGTGVLSNNCTAGAPYCYLGQCYTPFPLDLQGAMQGATSGVGAYQEVETFLGMSNIVAPNIAGVMFIVNRAPVSAPAAPPEAEDCSPALTVTANAGDPAFTPNCNSLASTSTGACPSLTNIETEALNAFQSNGLRTYFVVLGNDDGSTEPLQFFQTAAADVPQAITALDGTALGNLTSAAGASGAMGDVASFLNSVTQLGTCLYQLPPDVPSTTPASQVEVDFAPAGLPPGADATKVKPVANCTAATQASSSPPDGWSYDGTSRIRICGPTCTTLRNDVIAVAATQGAVPVTVTKLCSGTSADGGSTGGTMVGADSGAASGGSSSGTTLTTCGPANCGGCCEGNACVNGGSPSACGQGGVACVNCGGGTCTLGMCSGASLDASATGD